MTRDFPRNGGVFGNVCFKRREGSEPLHPVVNKRREAKKVFLEFLEPFSSEKGSRPPEALVGKGE